METVKSNFIEWCIERHHVTNHMYDKYLPYEFHLRMVDEVRKEFQHLYMKPIIGEGLYLTVEGIIETVLRYACFGHDLVEDVRVSWNDIVKKLIESSFSKPLAIFTADLIRSVTNDGRGRNRDERMPDYIYEEMKLQQYGVFIKLCDRIANVRYGLLTKSSKTEMYRRELPKFKAKLYTEGMYEEMWTELENLLRAA